MMFTVQLESLYKAIQESEFREILGKYHFEFKSARYEVSPRSYETNMIIFESTKLECRLLFVYPGGTVDVYIGALSADFSSDEWIRVDYLAAFFSKQPIAVWHSSKLHKPEGIMRDVLSKIYRVFTPFVQQSIELFQNEDDKWRTDVYRFIQESLQQK